MQNIDEVKRNINIKITGIDKIVQTKNNHIVINNNIIPKRNNSIVNKFLDVKYC